MTATGKISQHYTGEQGERYRQERQSQVDHAGYAINYSRFKPYLKPTDVVLDFGCGNGGMLRLMIKDLARVEGLEVNPASASIARQSGAVVYGSLDELPKRPTYDAVVTNHVLEHVRDVCGTLEELRASIKPGGLLIASLPIDDFRAKRQRTWSKDDIDRHLHTWTPRLFANVLYESGYEVLEARVLNWAWHPRALPMMKFGLGPIAFRLVTLLTKQRGLLAVGRAPNIS